MASDGKVEIGVELNAKNAKSNASKLGKDLESAIKSGTKGADKALDGIGSKFGKTFSQGGTQAKEALSGVGKAGTEMGSAVGGASDGVMSKLGGIAAKAFAVVGGLEAIKAAAGFVMDAVNAYGNYEQLVGGVETLFGAGGKSVEEYAQSVGKSVDEVQGKYQELTTAENMVMENAKNAWKDAGVSANTYMEQATSFSASLIQSLDGDTVAAAEAADTAIKDMSDNANKMGTDIGRIQDAYQGFAKQNYTMLDNLKLGYGGTKTEMERLIEDANKLKETNGEAADLTIDSYADVIEAIHLVQDNMGITGTTALEAATTIEGSMNMAKAAYENFLVGLADDNANIVELSQNLVDSIITAADNLLPRIMEVVQTASRVLVNVLPDLLGTLGENIMPMVMGIANAVIAAIPSLIVAATQLVGALATGFLQGLPEMLTTIVGAITEGIPMMVEAFYTVFTGVVQALPEIVSGLVAAIPTIIEMLVSGLMQYVSALVEGFTQLFLAVVQALPQIIAALVPMIPMIVESLCNALVENMPLLIEAFIQLFMAFVQATPTIIMSIIDVLPSIVQSIVTTLVNMAPQLFAAAVTMFVQFVAGIVSAIPQIISTIGDMASQMLAKVQELPGKMLEVGKNIIDGIWNGISGAIGGLISNIQGACSDIMGAITGFFGIHSPSTLMRDMVGKNLADGIAVGFNENNPFDDMEGTLSDGVESLESAANALAVEIPVNEESTAETGTETVEAYTAAIEDEALNANESGTHMAEEVTDGMNKGVSEADKIGNNTAESYIAEINRADASPAASKLKDGAITELKKGESEARESGVMASNGFIQGLESGTNSAAEAGRRYVRAVLNAMKQEGQQGSPWKTTIEMGEFAAEGLTVGFERVNPMAQIADMVRTGLAAMTLATQAQSVGGNITNNNQTNNFYGKVETPDEFARKMRMYDNHGLAGSYL